MRLAQIHNAYYCNNQNKKWKQYHIIIVGNKYKIGICNINICDKIHEY